MMSRLFSLILILTIILGFYACKQTEEVANDKENVNVVQAPPPGQDKYKEYLARPRSSDLSPAEIGKIVDYAEKKARLACKIADIEKNVTSEAQAAEAKQRIIEVEESIKNLEAEINPFLNTFEKQRFFNKAYEQELKKCQGY